MRLYWVLLLGYICLSIASVMVVRNLRGVIDEQQAIINSLMKELERPMPECVPPGQLSIKEIMEAFTTWTPMTAAEIEHWQEKENDARG